MASTRGEIPFSEISLDFQCLRNSWETSYRFGYGGDTSHYPFKGGVHHSDDLMYLFPYPPDVAKLNANDTKVAQTMVDLWTSFATNGIPELPQRTAGINALTWQPFFGEHLSYTLYLRSYMNLFYIVRFEQKSGPYGAYLHIDEELRVDYDYRKEFVVSVQK